MTALVLFSSILLRLAALAGCCRLALRFRDRRLLVLSAMLALMALRQSLMFAAGYVPALAVLDAPVPALAELPGLVVSVLAVVGLVLLERVIADRSRQVARARLYRAELRRAHELGTLGLLAGGAAHEFNNAVTSIHGFAELALERGTCDDEAARQLRRLAATARQAQCVAKGLQAMVQQDRASFQVTDAAAQVRWMLRLLRVVLPSGLTLVGRVGSERLALRASPSDLRSIVVGLCAAAQRRWSGLPGASIEVGAGASRAGSPPKPMARLWVALVEAGPSRQPAVGSRREGPHADLDDLLPVVREAVERLGGTMEAAGRAQRCEVRVFLPLAEGAPNRAGTAAQQTSAQA
ncbi:MAG: hypothetical protein D6815_02765 [Candidatus Dadabacteria bacterium]|nr:MAG: hypothetical protein D6815_02765 [Candidatus Dadabacteria bacterium]